MSMSTHIKGFRPPDNKWKRMKEVWETCKIAEIDPPAEVYAFFESVEPDENGVEVELEKTVCCKEWSDEYRQGFEIFIEKLPEDVKIIRFYNSW